MTTPEGIHAGIIEHDEGGGGDDDIIIVGVHITEPDGTSYNAGGHAETPVADEELADLLIRALTGVAAMRGSGVWMALQRRLNLEVQ